MNPLWQKFLLNQGAKIESGQIISFKRSGYQSYSAKQTYLCDLSSFGLIQVTGDEAHSFLHGQFTNDLNKVSSNQSQLSSYCNHKGRMFAVFQIYKKDNDYFIVLPQDVIEQTISKLKMFKLRAQVELSNQSDNYIVLGIVGPDTENILNEKNINPPKKINETVHKDDLTIIRLHSENYRALLISKPQSAIALCENIKDKIEFSTNRIWNLHDINSGIPQISSSISEAFIPQMTNMDLIDGVSFNKGCYPGQEVVARTHYLGKPNRRMYRVTIAGEVRVEPAMNIYSPEDATQPVGKIVLAQKISKNQTRALVVMRTEKENDENLALNSIKGPKVSVESLPYSLDTNSD